MAQECLRLAQKAEEPADKLLLLEMAQAWLTLANNTERLTGRLRPPEQVAHLFPHQE